MMNFSFLSVFSSVFMIFCGLWSFISYNKHLLNSLLSLEFMMLGVFWLLSLQLSMVGSEIYFSLFFLTLAVCEGALGLSLLVLIVRSHGNDYFKSFNLLEC
uniref:NADH-ubiquinone oxidoreductase chain 4L n=2 Tax=Helice TaxID=53324 RepID=A0A162JG08_9EUCA|nr:NADH dehydrogenase subunit 4L [Helice tientsinensis]YP_009346401.1 NADH dehydrogenase subunit 4L [Helice latimera]YP_010743788.1 NADH dehydrogenase subunit 4L [Helice tridens]ALK01312.1 NADH dehydrogenase subunit 4L [Helice tientsinensis]AOR53783.1 NADH dehydrogenase subunit 4L [Helice latimera]WET30534.1 NADH dehydrogenase subunit 4L [Helice tridens]